MTPSAYRDHMTDRRRNEVEPPGEWVALALCRAFPDVDLESRTRPGLHRPQRHDRLLIAQICQPCPVMHECRAWAVGPPEQAHGMIAGGTIPRERQKLRRDLNR